MQKLKHMFGSSSMSFTNTGASSELAVQSPVTASSDCSPDQRCNPTNHSTSQFEASISQTPKGPDQLTSELLGSITSLNDLMKQERPESCWLVDRLIPQGGITSLIGEPAAGKTFLSLEIARCVASGTALFGEFATTQSPVLLISKEDNIWLTQERLELLDVSHDLPIGISTHQDWYFDNEQMIKILEHVGRASSPQLLIIDSFIRIIQGDENVSRDVARIHRVFKSLVQQGFSILFIHHIGKKRNSQAIFNSRGSSDISAMVDCQNQLTKEKGLLKIEQTKSRLSEPLPSFLIQFPNFDEGAHAYQFSEWLVQEDQERLPTLQQQLAEPLFEVVQQAEKPVFQKEIDDELKKQGLQYAHGTLSIVLKQMVASGKLVRTKEGRCSYYELSTVEGSNDEA